MIPNLNLSVNLIFLGVKRTINLQQGDLLLAQGAKVVVFQPVLDAMRVEKVSDVAGQRGDFDFLSEICQADCAVLVIYENA